MNSAREATRVARPYRQGARAEATARTRTGILDAAIALAFEQGAAALSLADIAGRAGVSVQTVLRHFGSRDALLDAAIDRGDALVAAERRAPAGDVPGSIHVLFDHYEGRGDGVLRMLAQEDLDDRMARVTASGRQVHRDWVRDLLGVQPGAVDREDVVDQLVVVTDVYSWKLLRRDFELDRPTAQRRMVGMVDAIIAAARGGAPTDGATDSNEGES